MVGNSFAFISDVTPYRTISISSPLSSFIHKIGSCPLAKQWISGSQKIKEKKKDKKQY